MASPTQSQIDEQNRLLAALPRPEYERLLPDIEPVSLAQKQSLTEPDEPITNGRLDRGLLVLGLLIFVAISYSFYFVTPIAAVVLGGFLARNWPSAEDRRFVENEMHLADRISFDLDII